VTSPLVLLVGFVAGLLTIVSPCVLPVLPAVLASGITAGGRRRAAMIALGLAVAFALSALFSIRVLQALGLPLGLRYDIAIVVLFVLAAGLVVPRLGELLERPFARLVRGRGPARRGGAFVLGASLGMLYLPCGGPILATIAAVGNPGSNLGGAAVLLAVAYSLGIALPMFALVVAADRVALATGWLRAHAVGVRRTGGVLLAVSAVAITFGAATSLQTEVPSYTASIEAHLTHHGDVSDDLSRISNPGESQQAKSIQRSVTGVTPATGRPMADQVPSVKASVLPNYGRAPAFTGITHWFNTANGKPLTVAQLRGKVVLVDFWTYSCINCLRSLPHVEAWYSRYASSGLVVVGVHTPEFDFEHSVGNVSSAISRLGVHYPVAVDDSYGTWNAWGNQSWPAEYVIDRAGDVRYGSVGEGDYGQTEAALRALLATNGESLPAPTDVADATPQEHLTAESYLGYERLARYDGTPVRRNRRVDYRLASRLAQGHLSYGGEWTVGAEDAQAGRGAELRLAAHARDIYLVLAGTGTVTGSYGGRPITTTQVRGVPTLYRLVSLPAAASGTLDLHLTPGLRAYDFTFG
jgi:cytochrome c biogenesis protein CcdA/thiol-disulfide isomerase/thioredoxin